MGSMRKVPLHSLPTEGATPLSESMRVGRSNISRQEDGADPLCMHQQSSLKSQVVLVIDDSPTVRKILETCLRRAGYQVASFPDGVTALRWLLTPGVRLPDLLLLDIEMPGMDSYAVAQYLKTRPQYRSMPIVMLSGRHGVLDRLKARLAGAEHYLTKPFHTQTILATIQAYLAPTALTDQALMETNTEGTRPSETEHLLERTRIYG